MVTGMTLSLAINRQVQSEESPIQVRWPDAYELADGSLTEFDFGLAIIELMGEIAAGRVILGREGCEPIFVITALESVGIVIDPASQHSTVCPPCH
jgi:hypothetical protein